MSEATGEYKEVNVCSHGNETVTNCDRIKLSRRNILRQLLVSSTMWTTYFIYGIQLGAPTVIIPQLRKEANSSTLIEDDLDSWITSMFSIGALPWSFTLPLILHYFGRKRTYILICFMVFVGTMIIYLSRSITHILLGEFVMGILLGGHHSISPVVFSEYSSPKHRGLFLTIKSASGLWGIWVANIIGTFWHWKNIYLVVFLCNIYTLTVFAWPESPYWLAKERRFTECAKTYRQLNGTSERAKKELDLLIHSYEINEDKVEEFDTKSSKKFLNPYFRLLSCKTFYKPLLLGILLGLQYHFMGKFICSMYAIQILKKINQNEAYKGMLILDGVTVVSAYCGCAMTFFCKRRTMLFTTSVLSIMFLYVLALYFFLIHQSIISENNILSICLLAFFSVNVCSGPMILLASIYGELISYKHVRLTAMIYGLIMATVMATSLKASLFLFQQLTLSGAFLFFAIMSTMVTYILYLYLPETKNMSYHEIENYFKGISGNKSRSMGILQPDS